MPQKAGLLFSANCSNLHLRGLDFDCCDWTTDVDGVVDGAIDEFSEGFRRQIFARAMKRLNKRPVENSGESRAAAIDASMLNASRSFRDLASSDCPCGESVDKDIFVRLARRLESGLAFREKKLKSLFFCSGALRFLSVGELAACIAARASSW